MADATANMVMISYDPATGIGVYRYELDGVERLFARQFYGKMRAKMDRQHPVADEK